MAYTGYVVHSGEKSGGKSMKNAQDVAVVLEALDTSIQAAGSVSDAAAATAATLTGSLTGTNDNALNDITYNGTWSDAQATEIDANFKEVQDEINKLITDVASIRTAVNALIATMATS